MSVVGVDFGLQNAVIAAAGRGGVDVILNGNANRLNPCMVSFGESRHMGEQAAAKASSNYKNTIRNMKRLIGLAYDDPRAQREYPMCAFSCVPLSHSHGGPDSIGVKVNLAGEDKVLPIEAVAGMMLKHMGHIAAHKAGQQSKIDDKKKTEEQLFPQDWVVAIPSYYTDAQRRAFLAGCEVCGIHGIQRLMHESTATALAYGIFKDVRKEFTKEEPTHVMFLDMGSSSCCVSIVAFEPGKLTVKSCCYDENLGGRDCDQLIGDWLAAKFEEKFKGKLSGKPMDNPKVRLKMLTAAEKAKKTLSPAGVKEARITLECIMDDLDFSIALKADEYEAMCQPLLDRVTQPITDALAEAKLQVQDLTSVEIVGGSTRIGFLKKKISDALGGMTLSTTMNADEAVCRGAALQSAILSPRFKVLPYEIVESQPFPIQLAWDGDVPPEVEGDGSEMSTNSVVMFDRGLNFPIVRRVTLRRSGEFVVTASYDGSKEEIASFKVKAPEGEEKKVRVNVKEDIHGIIRMSSAQMVEEIEEETPAVEVEAGKEGEAKESEEKKKKIKKTLLDFTETRPLEWSKAEKDQFFEAEVAMTNTDRVVRETADMRNELESYIYSMRDKIISDSQLAPFATDEEKSSFSSALETTENWLYEDGFDAVKSVYSEKLAELKKYGVPIQKRQTEAEGRPKAVSLLQSNIETYKTWLNESSSDEKYAHITDEERQECHTKCDEITGWLYDMLDKQAGLAQNVDPVLAVAEIKQKSSELTGVCSPIKHKRAPKKEKPKEEPKKEEDTPMDAATDEKKAKETKDGEEPEPMETDEKPAEENGDQPMEVEE